MDDMIKTAADAEIARLGEIMGNSFADAVLKKFASAGITTEQATEILAKEAADNEVSGVVAKLKSLAGAELVSAMKSLSPDMQRKVLEASPELKQKLAQAMAGK